MGGKRDRRAAGGSLLLLPVLDQGETSVAMNTRSIGRSVCVLVVEEGAGAAATTVALRARAALRAPATPALPRAAAAGLNAATERRAGVRTARVPGTISPAWLTVCIAFTGASSLAQGPVKGEQLLKYGGFMDVASPGPAALGKQSQGASADALPPRSVLNLSESDSPHS